MYQQDQEVFVPGDGQPGSEYPDGVQIRIVQVMSWDAPHRHVWVRCLPLAGPGMTAAPRTMLISVGLKPKKSKGTVYQAQPTDFELSEPPLVGPPLGYVIKQVP